MMSDLIRATRGAWPGEGLEPDADRRAALSLLGQTGVRYGGIVSPAYYIRDEFSDTRDAEDVDGTPATPGAGIRHLENDVEGTVLLADGSMKWSKITGSNSNNPWLHYGITLQRAPGSSVHFRARHTASGGQFYITIDEVLAKPPAGSGQVQFRSQGPGTVTRFICGDANNINLSDIFPLVNEWGEYVIVLKSAGAILYKMLDGQWSQIVERNDGSEPSLQLMWAQYGDMENSSAGDLDFIRVTSLPPAGIPVPS